MEEIEEEDMKLLIGLLSRLMCEVYLQQVMKTAYFKRMTCPQL